MSAPASAADIHRRGLRLQLDRNIPDRIGNGSSPRHGAPLLGAGFPVAGR